MKRHEPARQKSWPETEYDGPYRRSILKYGLYKDRVRFFSQFPTTDVEAASEKP